MVGHKKIFIGIIIMMMMMSLGIIYIIFIKNSEPNIESRQFFLWATSDPHSKTNWSLDISFNGTNWSGPMIQEDVKRIDFAFIAGDILKDGGTATQISDYINRTCSCIVPDMKMDFFQKPANQRIWGFALGNHEEHHGGCTEAAKGLGLDPTGEWYNNNVTMGNSYNYTVQRGNLLFVFIGGDRSSPTHFYFGLNRPSDFEWLRNTVIQADNQRINVIFVTHTFIFNSTNSYDKKDYYNHDCFFNMSSERWEPCNIHLPGSTLFNDPWPGNYSIRESCDQYWELINSIGNINLWFNGHTHTNPTNLHPPPHEHAGWNTTLGVERDIQKSLKCTFINCAATGPDNRKFNWSYSRVGIFTPGSKDIIIKSFDHNTDKYGHDEGWQSSHQDITITNCLKYAFDPNPGPSTN